MFKNSMLLISVSMITMAQTPASVDGVLRSNSRLVALDVLVNNDKGSVRGLTKDDFILEDKGKKQTISLFEITEPGKSGAATPLSPGVASNRINSQGLVPDSATVILYDRINAPSPEAQAFVRNQVLRLLAGLKESDRVGFYSLGFNLRVVNDYDQDPTPLARVAKALQSSGNPPASFSPVETALFKNLAEALSPMQQPNNQARVNITYPAFRTIARHLAGVPGRKNLVWVASVFPLTFGNQQERRKNDQAEVDAFRNNLTEANIAIYPVDPGGTGASFNQTEAAPVANEGSLMPGSMRNSAGTSSSTNTSTSQTGNQTMLLLADATGGKAFRNANDIEPALREVIALSGYTYTLGFYPDEKTLDNKTHDLKVTFVKKPATEKAKAIHRKMYFAWGPTTPPEALARPTLGEILEDPLAANSIGLMAATNPDPAKPGAQVLNIRIGAGDLQFVPKGEQLTSAFEIGIAIEGAKVVSLKTYAPVFTAEELKQIVVNGLDTGETIDTNGAAGIFRIAILDKATGASGSLRVPFVATK
ncbi:MAG: VWA domain-containing protein [Bryobacteraceae bacterium]